jgi:hypothetical protein
MAYMGDLAPEPVSVEKEASSFLKKSSKKLSTPGPSLSGEAAAKVQKFFGSFFQKRTASLPVPRYRNC